MDAIRRLLERNANAVERSRLEARRAKLAGGVALIKVGTSTETEMKEKRSRVDDALHASRAAVEEGIGAGGGVALLRPTKVTRLALRNAASIAGLVLTTDCLVAPVDAVTPDLTM